MPQQMISPALNSSMALSLFLLAASVSLALGGHHGPLPQASPKPINVDPKLDCALKELAWDYAKKLLPWQGSFQSAYDALQLSSCNVSLSSGRRYPPRPLQYEPRLRSDAIEIFVSTSGDDSNPGTMTKPVKTIAQALRLYRLKSQSGSQGIVYLRGGTFYLSEPVVLGPEDSNLMITAYQDEKVTISGGKVYEFTWKEVVKVTGPIEENVNAINDADVTPGKSNWKAMYSGTMDSVEACWKECVIQNCFAFTWFNDSVPKFAKMCYFRMDGLWAPVSLSGASSAKKLHIVSADLSSQNPTPFTSLFLNGRRAVRARYPDGNPETMGLHTTPTGYVSKAEGWGIPVLYPPAVEIHIDEPSRVGTHFPNFSLGIGGPVAIFDPPESYWGTKNPIGGDGRTFLMVTGLNYSANEGFANRTWKKPETGVVHAFHGFHWGNWMFAIKDRINEKYQLDFAYGGYQEARGLFFGAEWFVENIKEELDAPGEWYYDDQEMKLYYYPNDTYPDSGIATALDRLISIVGSEDAPVFNITIANLTFAHTRPTFLDPYFVPSGGDWSVHKGGAVFAEGVDGFLVQNCVFDSPGGNGLYMSEYMRNAVVEGNEFVYTGDSAIVAIGTANLIDGTDGNQPRGLVVMGNLMHEIGVFGKQTSGYMQSVACQTHLIGNVMFNGPRAGINFNDGFGGGNLVKNNLIFNMMRETSDNGCFNSWDRQPYLTKVKNGTPSLTPAQNNITLNFFINNYHSTWPIDHDDGSCYYYDTYNYLVYGGYKNYLGHTKIVKYNYYISADATHDSSGGEFFDSPYCAFSKGMSKGEVYANNTCVIGNPNVYDFAGCEPKANSSLPIPFTANNTFHAPNSYIYFNCNGDHLTLEEWQKLGYDVGSTVAGPVSDPTLIQWGKMLFDL